MTIQEAVQLVLQAGTMGRGSEIFMLDMGTPVKIVDLARNMISLAGFTPGEDIEIVFTGARPGEKIVEELSLAEENTVATAHSKIRVFKGRQLTFSEMNDWIADLQQVLSTRIAAKSSNTSWPSGRVPTDGDHYSDCHREIWQGSILRTPEDRPVFESRSIAPHRDPWTRSR